MQKGMYVRCPLIIEEHDEQYPRSFVFAQVQNYNKLSDMVEVKIHDLFHSRKYYPHVFSRTTFPANKLERCLAMPGSPFKSSKYGHGHVLARVPGKVKDDEPYNYYVRLAEGTYLKLSETEMEIDYSQMNYSPLKQMMSYEFQHPSWYANRLKVSRNAHVLNNATHGFKVLAGCRTFLLPHQISTISRCFEFHPIRYMLADEVGLGKTIEACGIVKIMLSENSNLKTLLVVPGALINQWKNELKYKFNLSIDEKGLRQRIVPLEELVPFLAQEQWDIVVIDEVHRLLTMPLKYHTALELSKKTSHILLLSATPIQDRKEEYLRLLTLLNPDQYEKMPLDVFAGLVQKQKNIQRVVNQQLKRMDKFDQYGPAIIDKLNEICDRLRDNTLRDILAQVDLNGPDGGQEAAELALSYICENYRLERNVIRNRRELLSREMPCRTLKELPYHPATADDGYYESTTIESVLNYLSDHSDGSRDYIMRVAQPLLSAVFSSPWALQQQLKNLGINDPNLVDTVKAWSAQALQEIKKADHLMDDPFLIKGRLLHVLDFIEQNTDIYGDPNCKLVVFTGHNPTLQHFHRLVCSRLSKHGIAAVCFGQHMKRTELEDSVYEFQNNDNCRMIICDEIGGEGRNFQNAKMIIHLDLPWSANVLEQRIGRLDRLGRPHNMDVLSVVVYSKNTVEEQLFKIWKDGMQLFHRSLSGLEIITGELNQLIVDALLNDFHNGLINAFDSILETTEKMREAVLDEQLFDIGATIYRPLNHAVELLLTSYGKEEDDVFSASMIRWSNQVGLPLDTSNKAGLVRVTARQFSPRAAMQSLFIPPNWRLYDSSPIIRRENQILGTFNREMAIKREDILFFAPGDPFYDSIINNALGCGRGRCSAIAIDGPFNYSGFVFIYNIEPKIDELIENNLNPQMLSQFRIFLPLEPLVVFIPLNSISANVPEEELRKILSEHWRIREATHLGKRTSSRGLSPLERFRQRIPEEEWKHLVIRSEAQARRKAKALFKEYSDLQTAKREIKRIINGYWAQCLYFGRDPSPVREKAKAYQLVYHALVHSRLRLDSACFLRVVCK